METSTEKQLHSDSMMQRSMYSSAFGTRSNYISPIQALSVYYDDEDEICRSSLHKQQQSPSSPLPFAVEEPNDNHVQYSSRVEHENNLNLNQAAIQQSANLQVCHVSSCNDEAGIVILNPDNNQNDDVWSNKLDQSVQHESQTLDSIIMSVAAKVNVEGGGDSFEKLLQQAENGCHEVELQVGNEIDLPSVTQPTVNPSPKQHQLPIRTTQLAHDKFLVEVDILPNNNRSNVRDAIDILANVDLLHLWFDPIPAVFTSTVRDGSGNYSPLNNNERNERHRDGEWIEISTPPLILPRDSRISSCFRFFWVRFRSLIGFPARIRSTILIERSACRMGMTIGPYPDGRTACHDFNVRMEDARIVVSDEVRLNRSEEEQNGFYLYCSLCMLIRWFFRTMEWLFVKWYQPDLASYMSQTSASMEKLRILIKRGEEAAYAPDQLILEGEDWNSGDKNTLISTPLLG